jgi:hypothetical protein
MSDLETLFAAWQAAEARAADPDVTDAECEEACDASTRIEAEMMLVPAQTLRDLAMKIGALSSFGGEEIGAQSFPGSVPFWAEIRALAGMPPIGGPSMTPERRANLDAIIGALAPHTQWLLLVALERFQDGEVTLDDALEGVRQAVTANRLEKVTAGT